MINADQCRQQLSDLFQQQIEASSATNAYLNDLRLAIAENRLNDANVAISHPGGSLERTEALEKERKALVQSYGFTTDKAGLEHCISWCDDRSGSLKALHHELVDVLSRLEKSLQLSHLLVNKGRQSIGRALEVLMQQPSGTRTYTASGMTQSGYLGTRRLVTV